MAQFEFRCPIHGYIFDVDMDLHDTTKTCPRTSEDARCALPLFVAEKGTYRDA